MSSILDSDWVDVGPHDERPNPLIPPIEHGLILAVTTNASVAHSAGEVLEQEILSGGNRLGLPFAAAKVCSLHAGPTRRFRTQAARRGASSRLQLEHVSERSQFSWTSSEGIALIRERLKKEPERWITATGSFEKVDAPVKRGLLELRAAAKECRCRVLIILHITHGEAPAELCELADEHAELVKCDGEPDCMLSFLVSWSGLEDLVDLGHPPVQCTIKGTGSGALKLEYFPHISCDPEDRLIWLLRKCGLTNTQISELLDLDKATIGRRLKDLPSLNLNISDPMGAALRYAAVMKLEASDVEKAIKGAKAKKPA